MMSRLLLVDDKENIRTVMAAVLGREGYVVETAADGREALAVILHDPPDLVISDVRMEGLSGLVQGSADPGAFDAVHPDDCLCHCARCG
jgi:CheY-like chemotaxis protein